MRVRKLRRLTADEDAHDAAVPTRDEFAAQAKAMFARTRSMDEIVDRAYGYLLTAVGTHLAGAHLAVQAA